METRNIENAGLRANPALGIPPTKQNLPPPILVAPNTVPREEDIEKELQAQWTALEQTESQQSALLQKLKDSINFVGKFLLKNNPKEVKDNAQYAVEYIDEVMEIMRRRTKPKQIFQLGLKNALAQRRKKRAREDAEEDRLDLLTPREKTRRLFEFSQKETTAPPQKQEWTTVGRGKGKKHTPPTPSAAAAIPKAQSATKAEATTAKQKKKKNKKNAGATGGTAPIPKGDRGAVLIKPAAGTSYADALRKLKAGADPESAKVQIQGCRKTRDGGLLLRVRGGATERHVFRENLRKTLGEKGAVKDLTPGVQLEILDLDSVTEAQDVVEALKKETDST